MKPWLTGYRRGVESLYVRVGFRTDSRLPRAEILVIARINAG